MNNPTVNEEEWQTIRFNRNIKRYQKLKNPTSQESNPGAKGIQVKMFDAITGKFLNTQTFHYQGNLPTQQTRG